MKYMSPQDEQKQFQALFDHASIGIVLTNAEGKIINFNKYAEKQFGYVKDEIINKEVEILIPHNRRTEHIQHRSKFGKQPENRMMGTGRDLYAIRKDGITFPVEISLCSYTIENKNYVIAFIIDITIRKGNETVLLQQKAAMEKISADLKQLNASLEQKVDDRTKMLKETLAELEKSKEEVSEALQKEKELSDLKSRFVTMASHEFRTPLSTILSSASLIAKYTKEDEQEKRDKHINRIKEAVGNMRIILEDFLNLEKLEADSVKANVQVLNMTECVNEISKTIADLQQIAKRGQKIYISQEGIDKEIKVDMMLLKNILINLVSNAIKFSPENSEINILLEVGNDLLKLSVKDEGIGISEEDKEHLCERFFRAKNATNIQGTGLGLHIVSKYLELMSGKIEIESILNIGTTIRLIIPLIS